MDTTTSSPSEFETNSSSTETSNKSSSTYENDSSSSIYDNSTSESNINPISFHKKETLPKMKSKKNMLILISFVLFNVILVIINFAICFVFVKKIRFGMTEEENTMKRYQMVYFDKLDNKTSNRIVEFDFSFEEDFYSFDGGVVIKLESEGDIYEMCGTECRCTVECEHNEQCGKGFDCVEYECVNSLNNRRETIEGYERKIAQISLTYPIYVCLFGVFTSLFFAKEYAKNGLNEKCEEICPSSSKSIEVATEAKKSNNKKKYTYHCLGNCVLNDDGFFDQVMDEWEEAEAIYPDKVLDIDILTLFRNDNADECGNFCYEQPLHIDVIAESVEEASAIFHVKAQIMCSEIEYEWNNMFDEFDTDESVETYQMILDFGPLTSVCRADEGTEICSST